jgi:hypothetical protein
LIFGSEEEIARRLAALRGVDVTSGVQLDPEEPEVGPAFSLESEINWGDEPDARQTLHTLLPPELPDSLTPGQAAQLSELLQYFHLRLRGLLQTVKAQPRSDHVNLEMRQWQNLLDLQARMASYLRAIGEPEL